MKPFQVQVKHAEREEWLPTVHPLQETDDEAFALMDERSIVSPEAEFRVVRLSERVIARQGPAMQKPVRLRFTYSVEYDADPIDYDTSNPDEMAAIDQDNWDSGMCRDMTRYEDIRRDVLPDDQNHEFSVKVTPVE